MSFQSGRPTDGDAASDIGRCTAASTARSSRMRFARTHRKGVIGYQINHYYTGASFGAWDGF